MKYGYARVSTRGQAKDGNSLEAQEKQLKAAGAEKIYKEAFTGTKIDRPELDRLLTEITAGDVLIVTKLDRIARSASKGSELIRSLLDQGVKVHILNMGILDNTPTGRLIQTVMLAFSEFERDLIIDRTREGKEIARRNDPNFHEGRKHKYSSAQRSHAVDLLQEHTYREVEAMTGMSRMTILRAKRERDAREAVSDHD